MSVTTERMAAGDPAGRQEQATRNTMGVHGLDGIGGTARQIAARRWLQFSVLAVPIQGGQHEPAHHRRSHVLGDTPEHARDIVAKCRKGNVSSGSIMNTEEVQARWHIGLVGEDRPKSAADPIPHHRIPDITTNCVPHMGYSRVVVGQRRPAQPTVAAPGSAAGPRQCVERRTRPERADQADNRSRPLRRLDPTMRRPALVDMRLRKPWRLARRRAFGWKVLFTIRPNRHSAPDDLWGAEVPRRGSSKRGSVEESLWTTLGAVAETPNVRRPERAGEFRRDHPKIGPCAEARFG